MNTTNSIINRIMIETADERIPDKAPPTLAPIPKLLINNKARTRETSKIPIKGNFRGFPVAILAIIPIFENVTRKYRTVTITDAIKHNNKNEPIF